MEPTRPTYQPLICRNGQIQRSPYKIMHKCKVKLMRIKEVIIKEKASWYLNKFTKWTERRILWWKIVTYNIVIDIFSDRRILESSGNSVPKMRQNRTTTRQNRTTANNTLQLAGNAFSSTEFFLLWWKMANKEDNFTEHLKYNVIFWRCLTLERMFIYFALLLNRLSRH